ncbi:hypothetical protein GCM10010505_37860 [Kitasatospora aburaviensis]
MIESVAVSLLTVAATFGGGWFVTTRITERWAQIRRSREDNQAAARELQLRYGEFVANWKTWNALVGEHTAQIEAPDDAKWACLRRATEAEGAVEALLARVSAERRLTAEQIDTLGALRQAFKAARRTIRRGRPLAWSSAESEPYLAFKGLVAAAGVLMASPADPRDRPDAAEAARAFRAITGNRHETTWTATGRRAVARPGTAELRP